MNEPFIYINTHGTRWYYKRFFQKHSRLFESIATMIAALLLYVLMYICLLFGAAFTV